MSGLRLWQFFIWLGFSAMNLTKACVIYVQGTDRWGAYGHLGMFMAQVAFASYHLSKVTEKDE